MEKSKLGKQLVSLVLALILLFTVATAALSTNANGLLGANLGAATGAAIKAPKSAAVGALVGAGVGSAKALPVTATGLAANAVGNLLTAKGLNDVVSLAAIQPVVAMNLAINGPKVLLANTVPIGFPYSWLTSRLHDRFLIPTNTAALLWSPISIPLHLLNRTGLALALPGVGLGAASGALAGILAAGNIDAIENHLVADGFKLATTPLNPLNPLKVAAANLIPVGWPYSQLNSFLHDRFLIPTSLSALLWSPISIPLHLLNRARLVGLGAVIGALTGAAVDFLIADNIDALANHIVADTFKLTAAPTLAYLVVHTLNALPALAAAKLARLSLLRNAAVIALGLAQPLNSAGKGAVLGGIANAAIGAAVGAPIGTAIGLALDPIELATGLALPAATAGAVVGKAALDVGKLNAAVLGLGALNTAGLAAALGAANLGAVNAAVLGKAALDTAKLGTAASIGAGVLGLGATGAALTAGALGIGAAVISNLLGGNHNSSSNTPATSPTPAVVIPVETAQESTTETNETEDETSEEPETTQNDTVSVAKTDGPMD